jgi:hypothetical protein
MERQWQRQLAQSFVAHEARDHAIVLRVRLEEREHLRLGVALNDHEGRRKAPGAFAGGSGPTIHLEHGGHWRCTGVADAAHSDCRALGKASHVENFVF